MTEQYVVHASDLMKVWSMPKGTDFRQMTIRVPSMTFYKIKAIERMFPDRSRNELVADLLSTALEEFENSLPFESHQSEHPIDQTLDGEEIYDYWETGPRRQFRDFYRLESASSSEDEDSNLKLLSESESDAS